MHESTLVGYVDGALYCVIFCIVYWAEYDSNWMTENGFMLAICSSVF